MATVNLGISVFLTAIENVNYFGSFSVKDEVESGFLVREADRVRMNRKCSIQSGEQDCSYVAILIRRNEYSQ